MGPCPEPAFHALGLGRGAHLGRRVGDVERAGPGGTAFFTRADAASSPHASRASFSCLPASRQRGPSYGRPWCMRNAFPQQLALGFRSLKRGNWVDRSNRVRPGRTYPACIFCHYTRFCFLSMPSTQPLAIRGTDALTPATGETESASQSQPTIG